MHLLFLRPRFALLPWVGSVQYHGLFGQLASDNASLPLLQMGDQQWLSLILQNVIFYLLRGG